MRRALAIAIPLAVPPVQAYAADPTTTGSLYDSLFQGCWACGAYNTIGAIGLKFADTAFGQLSGAMVDLIGFVMAMWILYFIAKLLVPFGPPGSGHWNQGAAKLFKLLFVLGFLHSSSAVWDYVFTPIISGGLGLASALATATDDSEGSYATNEAMPAGSSGVDYCAPSYSDAQTAGPHTGEALAALEKMDCPLSRIQSEYAKGILIGVSVMGQATCKKSILSFFLPTENSIACLVAGLILIVLFGFGYMVFPFLLLDTLMRVVLVAVTSPLAIASILFKPTEKIASKSLWALVQCGLTLMFGAAIAGLGRALMAYILTQMSLLPNGPKLQTWQDLVGALENSCDKNFTLDFSSAGYYMLCGTAILMIFMMRRASSLASELTGISSNIGATAAGAAILGRVASTVGGGAQTAVNYMITKSAMSRADQVTGNSGGGSGSGGGNRAGEVSGNKQK